MSVKVNTMISIPSRFSIYLKKIGDTETYELYIMESDLIRINIVKGHFDTLKARYLAMIHNLIDSKTWKLVSHGYCHQYSYVTVDWKGDLSYLFKD